MTKGKLVFEDEFGNVNVEIDGIGHGWRNAYDALAGVQVLIRQLYRVSDELLDMIEEGQATE